MPIQFPNFERINFNEANPWLTGAERGMKFGQEAAMFPQQLKQQMLANALNEYKRQMEEQRAPYYPRLAKAETALAEQQPGYVGAQTGYLGAQTNKMNVMTPLEAEQQRIKNKNMDELIKSQINMYNMGGRGGYGVGAKEEMYFQQLVGKDNPQLSPDEIYQAGNILRQGGTTMPDGRPINLSPASRASWDRIIKGTTTSGALTPLIQASGAGAELNVLSDLAQKWMEPYGTTYFNMNPDQIIDSFKSDDKSQKRLGRFIAAQQIQYEIAQNEIKLAMGQPGVTSTQELLNLGHQVINTKFPKLSYTARQEANRAFREALEKGFEARRQVGVSPSSALSPNKEISRTVSKQSPFISDNNAPSQRKNPRNMSTQELKDELKRLEAGR